MRGGANANPNPERREGPSKPRPGSRPRTSEAGGPATALSPALSWASSPSQTAPRPDRALHSQPEGERGPPAQEKTTDAENEKNVKPSVE